MEMGKAGSFNINSLTSRRQPGQGRKANEGGLGDKFAGHVENPSLIKPMSFKKTGLSESVKTAGARILSAAGAVGAAMTGGMPVGDLAESLTLFQPKGPSKVKPDFVEERTLTTSDGVKLQAWWTPGPKDAPVMLHFHGSNQNLEDNIGRISELKDQGFRVLAVEYRGYGESEGVPTIEGLKKDAKAAYDEALKEAAANNILASGQSLGAGVAAQLASEEKVAGLILESGFTSLGDAASHVGGSMAKKIAGSKMPTQDLIRDLDVPVMVAHGGKDQITPKEMGEALRDTKPGTAYFEAPDAHHLNVNETAGFYDAVSSFATSVGATPKKE